ncbi:hypothetical protein GGR50DRAFT_695481 [Xylaria sp. CBS 124048]|nr:hypothetical protein GGR50DRAFT_695481 [Xylaria sp. CBS 124048]
MGFHHQPSVLRPQSSSSIPKGRAYPLYRTEPGQGQIEYLDRWSPRIDREHYDRVRLHRKRKDAIMRNKQAYPSPRSLPSHPANHAETGLLLTPYSRSRSSSDSGSTSAGSETETETDASTPSLTFSSLSSTFQDELDTYDTEIKSLQQNQLPTVPHPRARAHRIKRSEFGRKIAQSLKSWSFAEGLLYGGSSVSLRDTDTAHPASAYHVGLIFSAPHHTPNTTDERWVSVTDPHNTATPFGIVHSKYRKMVVVKTFSEHCICVPIYSNNGRGLEGKGALREWVSIRDVNDRRPEAPEGPNIRLLAVANSDFGGGLVVAGKSNVKLTELCSHKYASPATIEGELDWRESSSRQQLLELVGFWGQNGTR